MITSKVQYKGDLRTEATHMHSGSSILTDAPLDNQGRAEYFSPTDLVATALASCMITIMGILGRRENMTPINGTTAEITKVMYSDPRRIGEIHITLTLPKNNFSEKEKKMYENAGRACPVAKSLHPDIAQKITFVW